MSDRLTVYDVFAVLVPGAVFNFLLAVTLKHFVDTEIFAWSGGFGDATVLVITGYAAGVLLQALGKAVSDTDRWRKRRGDPATTKLLLPDANRCTEEFKQEALMVIQRHYGTLPPVEDSRYQRALRERTNRVYKRIEAQDPTVSRFLAEHDQMRAYAVGFSLLAGLAIGGMPFPGGPSIFAHLAAAVGYAVLVRLALWRMEDKDETLGVHVLTRYLEAERQAGGEDVTKDMS